MLQLAKMLLPYQTHTLLCLCLQTPSWSRSTSYKSVTQFRRTANRIQLAVENGVQLYYMLCYFHKNKFLHWGMKPEHLMVTEDGFVCIGLGAAAVGDERFSQIICE